MSRIVIDVPDHVRSTLAERASRAGHPSVEEYVRIAVVRWAENAELGPPPGASVASLSELQQLVLDRADDEEGTFEPDAAFYQRLRDRAANGPPAKGPR